MNKYRKILEGKLNLAKYEVLIEIESLRRSRIKAQGKQLDAITGMMAERNSILEVLNLKLTILNDTNFEVNL